MRTAILNIGLNVGTTEPAGQLRKALRLIQPKQFSIKLGEWEGIPERTLIAEIPAKKLKQLERICNELQQDAISYKSSNKAGLIFTPNYTGERYQFNESFFNTL